MISTTSVGLFLITVLSFGFIILLILTPFAPMAFPQSVGQISLTEPEVKTIDGRRLDQMKVHSQVLLSLTVENVGQYATPYVAILEVRDSSGFTIYLQFQKGTLASRTTTEIGVSWTPATGGEYEIRSFLLSDLIAAPVILSPVVQSDISVGLLEIEYADFDEMPYYYGIEPTEQEEQPQASPNELRQYALEKINEDRQKFHLQPVELSHNEAAQIHAEDVFRTKYISHWMTNGEKPYMTYSRHYGIGHVAQNVATSGDRDFHEGCSTGQYLCARTDPFAEIEDHQYGMMYEDEECCDNGHRDNILDEYHTHVSIGIAYDDYFFVIVQNFENQYITWTDEINEDNPAADTVTMAGYFNQNRDAISTNDITLDSIAINFDPLPTSATYEQNRDNGYYEHGEFVAIVVEPLGIGWYYEKPPDYELIEAEVWNAFPKDFELEFSLAELRTRHGDGVYTVIVWCSNENDEDSFVGASISLFMQ